MATTEAWLYNITDNVTEVATPTRNVAKEIRLVLLPLIVLCGTVGNGLSFLVLIRRRMRTTSVYFYLTVLSCSDTLVLYISAFKTWIYEVSGFELLQVSNGACKTTVFLILIALHTSSWLIVLLTVDRCVAVCFPLRAVWLCSVRHAHQLTAALILVVILYNLHIFWTFGLYRNPSGIHPHAERLYCAGNPQIAFMGYPFEVFKLASYCFLPFCLVLVMNCAIIYQIRATRHNFHSTQNSSRSVPNYSSARNHSRVTYMLLTVSFTWFVMTAPFSLLIFLGDVYKSPLGRTFIFLLMYTNHSVNFFLYCFTGRRFRFELKELFTCRTKPPVTSHLEMRSKTTSKSVLPVDERYPLKVSLAHCNGDTSDL